MTFAPCSSCGKPRDLQDGLCRECAIQDLRAKMDAIPRGSLLDVLDEQHRVRRQRNEREGIDMTPLDPIEKIIRYKSTTGSPFIPPPRCPCACKCSRDAGPRGSVCAGCELAIRRHGGDEHVKRVTERRAAL